MNARRLAVGLLALAVAAPVRAQDTRPIEARYTKTEYQVPMRDGKKLFTVVYEPRDTTRRHPILMTRTPYSVGPYGATAFPRGGLGPAPQFVDAGYIFVSQDVRGRFMSEGDFAHMTPWKGMAGAASTDESTDTYDTIDWIIKNVPRNNGRVGIMGVSYPGFFAAAALVNSHPALKAASPQAPQVDWFMGDDVHHHGAFWLTSAFGFFSSSGRARPAPTAENRPRSFSMGTDDGYAFFLAMGPLSNADKLYLKGEAPFWNDMMAHGTLDAFWEARTVAPHLKNVAPAVLTVSGWYDANNLYGALRVHEAIAKQSPSTSNRIVLGPWSHGQWSRGPGDALGELKFGSNTGEYFRDSIEVPFFRYHLENTGSLTLPHATAFETGTNKWRTFDAWPPKSATTKSIYLQPGGKLSFSAPPAGGQPAYDEYVSDPDNPVPFTGDKTTGMRPDYMARDQRFGSSRPDVLTYATDALDNDVTIAGSIRPSLYVSTSGTDSDWIVKLIDVDPATGFQHLVRGDAMRGKFRNSYSKPEPFVPGKVERVAFGTDDVLHTFKRGHKIMVLIQSTWFPLVDRNPQTFVDIYNAQASDFKKATERVYRSGSQASRIEVSVLP